MTVLTWQNGCRSEALVLFNNGIANIVTALRIDDLGGEQVGVKVWDANDAQEFFYRLETGRCLQERETLRNKFRSSGLQRDDASP